MSKDLPTSTSKHLPKSIDLHTSIAKHFPKSIHLPTPTSKYFPTPIHLPKSIQMPKSIHLPTFLCRFRQSYGPLYLSVLGYICLKREWRRMF